MSDMMILVTLLYVVMPTIAAIVGITLLVFEGKKCKRFMEKTDEH